jgi:hypothetical protein
MQSKSNHLLFAIWGCSEGYDDMKILKDKFAVKNDAKKVANM